MSFERASKMRQWINEFKNGLIDRLNFINESVDLVGRTVGTFRSAVPLVSHYQQALQTWMICQANFPPLRSKYISGCTYSTD
jgi:hypothetical protein